MKTKKAPAKYLAVDQLLAKHNMSISIVQDMKDYTYKMAIVFDTANKKTGVDVMTEDKIKELLAHLVDDRRY